MFLFLFFCLFVEASESKTIVFAQDNMSNDFRKAQVLEVKKSVLKNKNRVFLSSDAKGKTSLLIYQIDGFIKKKVDLIVVGTNDADAVVPVVRKAYRNGIAVIILDRGISSQDYTTFINSDNLKIGALGASYIAKKLHNKGTVLLFEGLQTADVTKLRSKGFMDEISKYKGITIIKRTGNYLRKDAIFEMEKLLKAGLHVDAIFSESDSMLSGVRSVLAKYKRDSSKIIMVGCDYTSEAREAIKAGTQSASVLFPLGGVMTGATAEKIFAGKKVPKHIFIPVKLISKENVMQEEPIF